MQARDLPAVPKYAGQALTPQTRCMRPPWRAKNLFAQRMKRRLVQEHAKSQIYGVLESFFNIVVTGSGNM
ncbi:MAG: hypothetical protein ACLFOY_12230 [Desulfatibacillaceae bacterium]